MPKRAPAATPPAPNFVRQLSLPCPTILIPYLPCSLNKHKPHIRNIHPAVGTLCYHSLFTLYTRLNA